MEDPEVVAAIVAGDPAGLAEAYDKYAVPLHSYCRSMLREPADAADAVQDTFLVATAKLRSLRDPGKLRSWLYAVARNECLRRLRPGLALSALEEAADMLTETTEVGLAAERAELQALVRAAIDGLNPGERDVIELSLVHELDGDELAEALGVSRNHAHAQLSRARSQLERSLGALIVARTGRQACPVLEAMLTGWDGQMTVLMRKRISRHIEQCSVCGERKRRELTPALFAGAMPMIALFPGFREQLLRMLADRSPAGLAHRLTVANRAGSFGPNGFPKPVRPPGAVPWHRVLHHPHAVLAGTTTSVVAAGAITVGVIAGPHHGLPSGGAAGGSAHGASVSAGNPSSGRGGPSGNSGTGQAPSVSAHGSATTPDLPVAGPAKLDGHRRILAVRLPVVGLPVVLAVAGLGWPRHLVGIDQPPSLGLGQRHGDGDVHAHRRGRRGPRLLDHGRARAGGQPDGFALIRIAGPRRERDDHRDNNQPGRRAREGHRDTRRPRDHCDHRHRRLARSP